MRRLQTKLRPFFVVELGLLRPIPCQTFKSITFIGCVLGLVLSKELENNDWVVGETILQKKLVLHLPSPTQCPSRSPRLLSPPSITQTFSEALIVRVEYSCNPGSAKIRSLGCKYVSQLWPILGLLLHLHGNTLSTQHRLSPVCPSSVHLVSPLYTRCTPHPRCTLYSVHWTVSRKCV